MKMNNKNILMIVVVLGLVAVVAAYQSGMFDITRLEQITDRGASTGDGQTEPATTGAVDISAAGTAGGSPTLSLDQETTTKLLMTLPNEQRNALLADAGVFRRFIDQEALNLSLLAAARSSQLNADATTQFLMQRGADNVLREIYMTSFINSKIPQDFPNDQQLQQYYEENRENLKVVERVSVWQIFLPVAADVQTDLADGIALEADRIAGELRSGKLDFAVAALQYSKHEPSRLNGGYMGIIKVSELIPEIRKAVDELASGEISPAIRSSMGYHILRKGEQFPAQELSLDVMRDDIKKMMINQARNQLRNAINAEVLKTYPVQVDEAAVEQWRQDLLQPQK